MAVASAAIAHW